MSLLSRRNVELEESSKVNQDTAYFTVRGTSLGTASLTFTASALGRGSALSEPKDIQVSNHSVSYQQTSHVTETLVRCLALKSNLLKIN